MLQTTAIKPKRHQEIIGIREDGTIFLGRFDGKWFFDDSSQSKTELKDDQIRHWMPRSALRESPVSYLINSIEKWGHDRNIILGSTAQAQYVKLMEEAGELAASIARGKDVRDDIGDMIVVLIMIAGQHGLSLQQCIATAWEDIKDRRGKMVDGVFIKEADL